MSGPPRNLKAFRRGQALRTQIRTLLEAHPPLLPPLTAPAIRARLTRRPLPALRSIRWHMAAIRLEAELAMLAN